MADEIKPVAWIRRHPDGTWTNELLPEWHIEQVRRDSAAWVALYTQDQLDAAVANERGRCASQMDRLGCDHCAAAIRRGATHG